MDEQIIYIIIAIVYFIVTALTGKKKKEEKARNARKGQPGRESQPQPEEDQGEGPLTMEELMGELFNKKEVPKPVEVKEVPAAEPNTSIEFRKQQEFMRRAEQARLRNAELRRREVKQEINYNTNKSHDVPAEKAKKRKYLFGKTSLKDAIIAKSILERPYE